MYEAMMTMCASDRKVDIGVASVVTYWAGNSVDCIVLPFVADRWRCMWLNVLLPRSENKLALETLTYIIMFIHHYLNVHANSYILFY